MIERNGSNLERKIANQSAIVVAIAKGHTTRPAIARHTGFVEKTIRRHIYELLAAGAIHEVSAQRGCVPAVYDVGRAPDGGG